MTIRLGLQIPNFSYGTPVAELFPAVKAQAQEAEAAGFDTVLVMDHFYQLPSLGEPDEPMLEAYTALGALASATEKVQLSTLVTGNTYRNPTLLAKEITTLDVVSAGRAILEELVHLAGDHGFHAVIARTEGSNEPSIALHKACGLEVVGVEREVGRKHGRWLDVIELQLLL